MIFLDKFDRLFVNEAINCVRFSLRLFRDRVRELNSSDERAINIIREKSEKTLGETKVKRVLLLFEYTCEKK